MSGALVPSRITSRPAISFWVPISRASSRPGSLAAVCRHAESWPRSPGSKTVTANQSTYWIGFELHWREFFRWVLCLHGARLLQLGGLRGRDDRPSARDRERIAAWQEGRTGMSFIDANMRELAATGYMSNRGRQNAASFLARDLCQDWRVGAAWFEAQLVDYDVASKTRATGPTSPA